MNVIPSTSCEKSEAPNRQYFEREIWRVNNCMSKILNEFWSEERREELSRLKSELADNKQQFSVCQENDQKLSECLRTLQTQHQQKVMREMHELEDNDLVYKDLTSARQKLAQVEDRYNKRNFSSMREEQLQVNELNRIRRNVQKLTKYVLLADQRKQLENDIKADRQKIRELRQRMRLIRDKIQHCRKQIKDTHQTFSKMKEIVGELKTEKRNLIEKYDDERKAYDEWIKNNKSKIPSSQPSMGISFDAAMEPLQLFHVQKTICRRLLDYIRQRLLSDSGCSNGTASQTDNGDGVNGRADDEVPSVGLLTDSDSADDLPFSFKHFSVINSGAANSINGSSNAQNCCQANGRCSGNKLSKRISKQLKKTSKRQGMPLSHGIDYIKLFNDIDVAPPKTIADAEATLKEVEAILQFYEEQTALTTHDDIFVQLEDGAICQSPILSVTGSTFTSPRSLSSCSLALKPDDDC